VLEFNLVVENKGLESDPASVQVRVELPPVIYSQAAFGPLDNLTFRTVLVLINPSRDPLHYRIEFFNGQGEPLDVMENSEIWDDQSFLPLAGGDARRLRFTGVDPERTEIGWARVSSTRQIRGLVLYQLVDRVTGELDSEVSLFSSPIGRRLSSFFDAEYNLALAVANPGEEEARLLIQLIDPELGQDLPVATKPLILQPGEHFAGFLDESFFSGIPNEFHTGTLLIEAISGEVAATILKTNRRGIAISSLPVVEEKAGFAPSSANNQ